MLWGITIVSAPYLQAAEEDAHFFGDFFTSVEWHGYGELRAGCRTRKDPHEKSISVMESRLQSDLSAYNEWADFKYKADVWLDGVTEEGEYDTREAWIFSRPAAFLDIKIGRQILTWGTGDLVFLNDLFPKDWQSFFIGRDADYLKAPSDAAKVSVFTDGVNMDLIYTPQFDSDRYVNGTYLSYWTDARRGRAGQDERVSADKPDRWFRDDEMALRLYRNIHNYEYALYGYWGFWKKPAGQSVSGTATFPRLNVYGASVRGQVGAGIGNMELAWYLSADDCSGSDPLIDNSEMRYLIGYSQEIGKDFTASLQYYAEHMLDYDDYREHPVDGASCRDRFRQVITLQLTRLLMNQNLELSLSSYYSPSDQDAYLRPKVHYKYSDRLSLEAGANVFVGEHPHTFFAQFEDNTNIYTAVRYDF